MPDERSAVSAVGVRVTLGGTEILRGIDLDVPAGTVLGVLGPSGAGKSTLFRALVGELPLAAGRISLAGVDVSGWPLWRRARLGLGYVPQTPSVLLDLSVRQNIRVFTRLARQLPRATVNEDAFESAARVGLTARLDVPAAQLSGGERRRLELLRALMGAPQVLICDEPFAGVDPARASHLGQLVRQAADAGSAVLLADHRLPEALAICDRALLLVDGRVEVVAAPEHFHGHTAVRGRYLT